MWSRERAGPGRPDPRWVLAPALTSCVTLRCAWLVEKFLRLEGCGDLDMSPHCLSLPPVAFLLTPAAVRPLPAPKFLRDQSFFVTFPCPQTSPPAIGHNPTIRTLCGLAVVMAAAPGEAFLLRGLSSQLQPDPVWGKPGPSQGLGRGQQPGLCPKTHPLLSPEPAGRGRKRSSEAGVRAKRPSETWCVHWWGLQLASTAY